MPDLGATSAELLDALGLFFLSALEIAAPLLGALFLTEVALGLLSKAAPQMNVFTLGFPIKILLTLLLAGLALPLLPDAVDGLVGAATRSGDRRRRGRSHVSGARVSSDKASKTEKATPKKVADARKKGQVAKSQEVVGLDHHAGHDAAPAADVLERPRPRRSGSSATPARPHRRARDRPGAARCSATACAAGCSPSPRWPSA